MPVEGGPAVRRSGGPLFLQMLSILRRVCGMPDYPAYVEHLRQHHPDCPVPTEREFFTQYTESRYGAGASRCC